MMSRLWVQSWFVWVLLAQAALAASPLTLTEPSFRVFLGESLLVYQDDSATKSYSQVWQRYQQGGIQEPAKPSLQYGYSSAAFWFIAEVRNSLDRPLRANLEIRYPPLDRVDVYLLNEQSDVLAHEVLGDHQPYDMRDVRSRIHMAPLEWEAQSRHYLLVRVQSESSLMMPMYLSSLDQLYQYEHYRQIAVGMFYGLALGLLFYNFFLFLIIKDVVYLYYIIYVAGYSLFMASIDGLLFQFWPQAVVWESRAIYVFPFVCGIFLSLFCRNVLETRKASPRSDLILRLFFWIYGVCTVAVFFVDVGVSARIVSPLVAINAFSILIIILVRFFQGLKAAFYLIFGMGGFCFGLLSVALGALNLHEAYDLTPSILKLGASLEMVFFSIALAQRISTLREQQRQDSIDYLQRMDKLKDDFLANTSHELRTPLTAIIGMADALLDNPDSRMSGREKHNLTLISHSGYRLANLVNDLLDFSKLKEKDITLHKQYLDLSTMVDTVIELANPLLAGKPVVLRNAMHPTPPPVKADEARIYQVLHNLIGNAIKFTDQGEIRITCLLRGDAVVISIEDSGIGIDHSKFDDIFRAFEQADSAIDREYGGTGLGLAITKHLVELHGGQIWVSSEPGRGTCFSFSLPGINPEARPEETAQRSHRLVSVLSRRVNERMQSIVPRQESQSPDWSNVESSESDAPQRFSGGGVINLLLVDDDPINLHVLCNHLNETRFAIQTAESGFEALAILQAAPVDLVLLDVMMPGMSGYDVCATIRETHSADRLPVIMITAKNQLNDLVMGFHVGANDYLVKPFAKGELLARVNLHLKLRQAILALAASEQHYRTIFDNALEGIFQLDKDGRLLNANPLLASLLGYPSPADFCAAIDDVRTQLFVDPRVYDDLRQILDSRQSVMQCETQLIRQDGSCMWGSLKVLKVVDEAGDVLRFEGLLEDVSDQKAVESTLYQAYASIEDRVAQQNGPTSHAVPAQVLDWQAAQRQQGLDSDTMQDILRLFRERGLFLLDALEAARQGDDFSELAHCCHTLKGSAASIGAAQLARVAEQCEAACRDAADYKTIQLLSTDVAQALSAVLGLLEAQYDIQAGETEFLTTPAHLPLADRAALNAMETLLEALDACEPALVKRYFATLVSLLGARQTQQIRQYIDNFDYQRASVAVVALREGVVKETDKQPGIQ